MVAVAIRTPVLAAAIVRDLEDDHGPEGEAVADGGQLVERPEPDHVETPDTETTPSSITTHGVAGSHAGEAIRESLYDELPGFDEYCAMDWAVCETVAHAASTDSR